MLQFTKKYADGRKNTYIKVTQELIHFLNGNFKFVQMPQSFLVAKNIFNNERLQLTVHHIAKFQVDANFCVSIWLHTLPNATHEHRVSFTPSTSDPRFYKQQNCELDEFKEYIFEIFAVREGCEWKDKINAAFVQDEPPTFDEVETPIENRLRNRMRRRGQE